MSILSSAAKAAMGIVNPYISIGTQPPKSILNYLMVHFKPLKLAMILTVFATALAAFTEVFLISYFGRLLDTLTQTPPDQIFELYGQELIWAGLFIIAFRPAVTLFESLISFFSFQCNSTTLFRWGAYEHISKQPIGWFHEDFAGRVANRLLNIGNHANDIIFRSINSLAFAIIYLIGIVIFLSSSASSFTLPILVWLVLYIGLVTYTIPRAIQTNHDFQGAKSAVMGTLVDNLSNFETIALYSTKADLANEYKQSLENIRAALFKSKMVQMILRTSLILLEGGMIFGFVGYGIYLWTKGDVSVGLIGVSLALCLRMSALAEHVFHSVWVIFEKVGSLREALTTIAQPLKIEDNASAKPLEVSGGEIELANVTHHYGLGNEYGGVDNLSLKIGGGEKVAIVGRSGAGKSTLINLIIRSFEAEDGALSIDGQSIKDVTQESLRAAIGVVSQQAGLLNQSVLYNITLGKNIPIEEIHASAREAKAHDFIMQLKDSAGRTGYDAHIGERGIALSGGQRQRLAIARALLKNAHILILDEATSALDSEVESEIQSALKNAMEHKTVIAIAHRLSTITQMDRIIVLDKGAIAEQGTHAELLKQKSLYSSLWSLQTDGFDIVEDKTEDVS
jgi:ATP-binding cassette subfamily B multidrug efflux pump